MPWRITKHHWKRIWCCLKETRRKGLKAVSQNAFFQSEQIGAMRSWFVPVKSAFFDIGWHCAMRPYFVLRTLKEELRPGPSTVNFLTLPWNGKRPSRRRSWENRERRDAKKYFFEFDAMKTVKRGRRLTSCSLAKSMHLQQFDLLYKYNV